MAKSDRIFDRWNTKMKSTWSFQVFNKYNDELNNMLWAAKAAKTLVYKSLGDNKALWTDKASTHLEFTVPKGDEVFHDLKDWSDSYNQFYKWTNLNSLLAISANFETYIATVTSLAIESDPGVLFQLTKSIDGVDILKKGGQKHMSVDEIITSLTKGDWNSRTSAFKKTFGSIPTLLESNKGELDRIRIIRNNVGHAFGRDIEESRNHEVKKIVQMENLSDIAFKRYQKIIWSTAKSIDVYLLRNHIGEYQAIAFYHRIYEDLNKMAHPSIRAVELKKRLGAFGDTSGKEFCKGLVSYYEGK